MDETDRARVREQFSLTQWIKEHYDFTDDDRLTCKRCGLEVTYVTKHAHERHGDDIEVMPVLEPALASKW